MNNKGGSLIFLISQPRAGSTLTQRILGAHSAIHTQSEPWILLLPLHAMKSENLMSSYDSILYSDALKNFTANLPGGFDQYQEDIAAVYSGFYEAILKQEKKQYFLDKTPRYYYILKELYAYFPKAKFIFLWRNPAAVISSIVNTWALDKLYRLSEFKDDLLEAPKLMLEGIQNMKGRALTVNYEDLIKEPKIQIQSLCDFIDIPFEDQMLQYNSATIEKWAYGDQETVYEKTRPDSSHADKWTGTLNNPQTWQIVNDYVSFLGESIISEMGYSFAKINQNLLDHAPDLDVNKHSIKLSQLLDNTHTTIIEKQRLQTLVIQKDNQIKELQESLKRTYELLEQNRSTLNDRNAELTRFVSKIDQLAKRISEKDIGIKEKGAALISKENQIQNILKKLSEKDMVIKEKDAELISIEKQIQSISKKLSEKDMVIKEKDAELISKEKQIQNISKKAEKDRNRLKESINKLSKKEELIKEKDAELITKENMALKKAEELSQMLEKIKFLKSKLNANKSESVRKDEELLQLHNDLTAIINSYSFKLGHTILWPIKKVIGK